MCPRGTQEHPAQLPSWLVQLNLAYIALIVDFLLLFVKKYIREEIRLQLSIVQNPTHIQEPGDPQESGTVQSMSHNTNLQPLRGCSVVSETWSFKFLSQMSAKTLLQLQTREGMNRAPYG